MIESKIALENEVSADGSGSDGHGTGHAQQPEAISPQLKKFRDDVAKAEFSRRLSHLCDHGAGAAHC